VKNNSGVHTDSRVAAVENRLSVTTAVKPSTASVESLASAMERTDTVAMNTATCVTAMVAATHRAVSGSAPVTISRPVAITRPIPVTGAVVAVSRSTIIAAAIIAVIPRTGTDKYTAYKIARSVEAIWRTGKWVIAVVSIGTSRSRANGSINGTHTDAD
jgi:hypothetical protein